MGVRHNTLGLFHTSNFPSTTLAPNTITMSTSTTQDHSNENEALVATLTTYSSPSPAYEDPDEAIGEIDPMTYIDLT